MSSPTFAPVQDLSKVYSSGIWSFSAGGSQEIFNNATSDSITAYVTICVEGSGAVQLMTTTAKGSVAVGVIQAGTCMGFALEIAAGQTLTLVQPSAVGSGGSVGTFAICPT